MVLNTFTITTVLFNAKCDTFETFLGKMRWVSKNRILRTHRTCCEKCLLIPEYKHEEVLIALRFQNILHIDIFHAVLMPDIMHVKCSYVSSRGSKFFLIKGYGFNRIPDHSELASSVSDWIFLDTGNDTRKRSISMLGLLYFLFCNVYENINKHEDL